jgi:hypothetical protein
MLINPCLDKALAFMVRLREEKVMGPGLSLEEVNNCGSVAVEITDIESPSPDPSPHKSKLIAISRNMQFSFNTSYVVKSLLSQYINIHFEKRPSFAESDRFPAAAPAPESLSELSLTPESAELPRSPTVAYVAVKEDTSE